MKRAKIMLAIVAVVGLAGAALATKAHRLPIAYFTCDLNDHKCTVPENGAVTDQQNPDFVTFGNTIGTTTITCELTEKDCGSLYTIE